MFCDTIVQAGFGSEKNRFEVSIGIFAPVLVRLVSCSYLVDRETMQEAPRAGSYHAPHKNKFNNYIGTFWGF